MTSHAELGGMRNDMSDEEVSELVTSSLAEIRSGGNGRVPHGSFTENGANLGRGDVPGRELLARQRELALAIELEARRRREKEGK
jgi:hypothetical protein